METVGVDYSHKSLLDSVSVSGAIQIKSQSILQKTSTVEHGNEHLQCLPPSTTTRFTSW